MEFIIKKELDLINGKNLVEFIFEVQFFKDMQGYKNLDINNTILKIDCACSLNIDKINKLKYPIYHSLTAYFFLVIPDSNKMIPELSSISFECKGSNIKSITRKEDIAIYLNELNDNFLDLKKSCIEKFEKDYEKQFL